MRPFLARALAVVLAPLAAGWVRRQERRGLAAGVSLSNQARADARALGVREPDRVRVVCVKRMPMPNGPGVGRLARWAGVLVPEAAGLCLGHAVFVRAPFWGWRELLAHELAHVAQYERVGGPRAFLRQYLEECLTVGYPAAPLELEATLAAGSLPLAQGG